MSRDGLGGEPACKLGEFDLARDDIRSRADLEELMRSFYRTVAMDDVLGPVFAGAQVDWSAHIPKLTDFWAWQLLGVRGYEGNPLRAHEPVHEQMPFQSEHYARWLELFETAVDEQFAGPTAEAAKQRARRMAHALRRLLEGTSSPGDAPVAPLWAPITKRG